MVLYILGQLSDSDVEWLAGAGTRRQIPAGQVLIQEGSPIDTMYMGMRWRLRARQSFRF